MLDDFARTLEFTVPREVWERMPRHPAYKYELMRGETWISTRHRSHGCRLALASFVPADAIDNDVSIRPIADDDWLTLAKPLAAAARTIPPLDMLLDDERLGATELLAHARDGGEGPLVPGASFVAIDRDGGPIGAAVVSLVRPWREAIDRPDVATEPNLTWIFVTPWQHRRGVGTSLLASVVAALRVAGHATLCSGFTPGNDTSMRFHWRNGFALEPDPLGRSVRRHVARSEPA